MRIEKRDGSLVRKILIGMIVDDTVCGQMASIWNGELFPSKWASMIGGWAVKYFNKYGKAPGRGIEGSFSAWAEKSKDAETINTIEKFMAALSEEYDAGQEINADYLIDTAATYFSRVRALKLAELIQGSIDNGSVPDALQHISTFAPIEVGAETFINVLQDKQAIREAFQEQQESIVKYRGALGKFFGSDLQRDALVAFTGPEKRGKTFWLLDLAWEGMCQRKRVAFFEVGDMSRNQIMRRFLIRASGKPRKPSTIWYPKSITKSTDDKIASVESVERKYDTWLSWQTAWKAANKVMTSRVKSEESYMRLHCSPNDTMTVAGIRSILAGWERDSGWSPDIVCIDYADILAAPKGIAEPREQINSVWKALRALSQERHCLVVTATQANAASYDAFTLSKKNFSGNKLKLAHATGIVGINQTPEEKQIGVQRLNWIVLRESDFVETKCVHVAGCMALARPAIRSTM